jgi:hypothetical protein
MKSRLFIGPLFVSVAKRPSWFTARGLYHFSVICVSAAMGGLDGAVSLIAGPAYD